MYVDIQNTEKHWRDVYQLCIGFVGPRPIALVSTVSADGLPNVAPFSFFNMVAGNPPVLMICPALRRDAQPKDTLTNIHATGEFVVAAVTESIAEPMVRCGADLPPGQSEFEFSGLTASPATVVKPPLVRESPVNIECRVRQIVELGTGPGGGNVVFGDILSVHVADGILDAQGLVDPRKFRGVGRLGGKWYCTVKDPYEMEIPSV